MKKKHKPGCEGWLSIGSHRAWQVHDRRPSSPEKLPPMGMWTRGRRGVCLSRPLYLQQRFKGLNTGSRLLSCTQTQDLHCFCGSLCFSVPRAGAACAAQRQSMCRTCPRHWVPCSVRFTPSPLSGLLSGPFEKLSCNSPILLWNDSLLLMTLKPDLVSVILTK